MGQTTIPDLERARKARTVHEVWTTLNNDQFFEFQQLYAATSNAKADMYDRDPANAETVKATLDSVQTAVDTLNQILVMQPGTEKADMRRCEALLRILQDKAELGTPRERWTPLQRVLIDLARKGAAHFTGLGKEKPEHQLVVFP